MLKVEAVGSLLFVGALAVPSPALSSSGSYRLHPPWRWLCRHRLQQQVMKSRFSSTGRSQRGRGGAARPLSQRTS
jgi:hypothetical protein